MDTNAHESKSGKVVEEFAFARNPPA